MKFINCLLAISIVSLLFLNCLASPDNKSNVLKEKSVTERTDNGGTLSVKAGSNDGSKDEKLRNVKQKTDKKTNSEVPTWVYHFVEGIFAMIGIAVAYKCFKSEAGHVDDQEWEEMHRDRQ